MVCCAISMSLTIGAKQAEAVNTSEAKKYYQGMDVFDLQFVSDPRISPNGKKVVYTLNSNGIRKI
jgi:hypothetical protein